MRKILLGIILSISIAANAQTYFPLLGDTTEWDVQYNWFAVIQERSYNIVPWNYWAQGDTVVNGIHYKNFGQVSQSNEAFIREDTALKKVWFLEHDSIQELLLYDFSLSAGDSVNLTFPNYYPGGPYPNGWYHVDSVVTKNILIGARKHFYLHNPTSPINPADNNNRFYLVWIEGVGNTIHPAYIYYDQQFTCVPCGPFSFSCSVFFDMVLSCEYNNGVKQYWDTCLFNCLCYVNTIDSCQYFLGGSIEEYKPIHVKISPNPAANEIQIPNVEFKIKSLEIYDMMGLEAGKIANMLKPTFDVSWLKPGLYFLVAKGEKGIGIGKFIIQK